MSKVFTFSVFLLLLFFDDNILSLIGYPHRDPEAEIIFKFHPVTYLSFILLAFLIAIGKVSLSSIRKNCISELYMLGICGMIIIYLTSNGRLAEVSNIVDCLMVPPVISILLYHTQFMILRKYRWMIYFAFIFNFALGLFEKIRHSTVLSDYYVHRGEFRSTALYGNPLNNALIMATMGIILYFSSKKLYIQALLLIFAVISLFCFGARGGIIGIAGGVGLGLIFDIFRKNIRTSIRNLVVAGLVSTVGLVVLFNTKLGDRLINQGSFSTDESALERVRSLNLLHIMKPYQIQWGMSDSDAEILMAKGGVQIIENYLVVWIVKFGIYLAVILLAIVVYFTIKQLKRFGHGSVIPILFTFLFLSAINNSLASKTRAISVLVLCCYTLRKNEMSLLVEWKI